MTQKTTRIRRVDGIVQSYHTGSTQQVPAAQPGTPSAHSSGSIVTNWPEGDDSWRTPAKPLIPDFDENGLDPEGYDARDLSNGFNRRGRHTETSTKFDPRGFGQDGLNKDGFDTNRKRVAPADR